MSLLIGSDAGFGFRQYAGPDGEPFVVIELSPGRSNSYSLYLDSADTADRLIDILRTARSELGGRPESIPGQGELFGPAKAAA